jgi:hypothetical protein
MGIATNGHITLSINDISYKTTLHCILDNTHAGMGVGEELNSSDIVFIILVILSIFL